MFYEGDLQSGIALALEQSKLVACFVRNDSEESLKWENEYLVEDEVASALAEKAIVLRMISGSREAGYLSAYFQIPTIPTLLLLHNGRVLLSLTAGLDKKQFTSAILRTFQNLNASDEGTEFLTNPQGGGNSSAASVPVHTETPQRNSSPTTLVPGTAPPATEAPAASSASSSSTPSRPSSNLQDVLAERRLRLEKDKQDKEAAEKAERKAKADARREATISAEPDSAKAKQATYAQQQRKRQQEAKSERERILRVIENDKAERKEKEEQRKALAKAEAEGNDGAGGLVNQQLARETAQTIPKNAKECAVQVRLFDGSTIRQRFPSEQTLRSHVRPWIEEQRSDGDTPYTFKQILTPMPNRTLSISEEEESLQSLGLTPSATLVMVPVQGYTAAYAGDSGLLSKGVSTGYNVISSGAGYISGALGTFLGVGQAQPQAERTSPSSQGDGPREARPSESNINVRTLRDQRQEKKDDHQLYNGNQVGACSPLI